MIIPDNFNGHRNFGVKILFYLRLGLKQDKIQT